MKWECEHCGNELDNLVALGESQPKQLQAVGWCPTCEATAWSKLVKKSRRRNQQLLSEAQSPPAVLHPRQRKAVKFFK